MNKEIQNVIKSEMSKEGLRSIAFCFVDYTSHQFKKIIEETQNFTCDD